MNNDFIKFFADFSSPPAEDCKNNLVLQLFKKKSTWTSNGPQRRLGGEAQEVRCGEAGCGRWGAGRWGAGRLHNEHQRNPNIAQQGGVAHRCVLCTVNWRTGAGTLWA